MISGFSRAYQALGDSGYLESATKAAQFVQSQLFKADSGVLISNTGWVRHNYFVKFLVFCTVSVVIQYLYIIMDV